MTFIVATNVIASRPPECRPTGTPHIRANFAILIDFGIHCIISKCKLYQNAQFISNIANFIYFGIHCTCYDLQKMQIINLRKKFAQNGKNANFIENVMT